MQVDKVVGDEETGNCRRRRSNGKRTKDLHESDAGWIKTFVPYIYFLLIYVLR